MDRDVVLYCRLIRMEWAGGEGVGWRITAERVYPSLYLTIDVEDIDDGLAEMVKMVEEKLLINPKTRNRARRK